MPSTTPPVAASSSQMCRMLVVDDRGRVGDAHRALDAVDRADRQRDVEQVAAERRPTSACRSPRRPASACCDLGSGREVAADRGCRDRSRRCCGRRRRRSRRGHRPRRGSGRRAPGARASVRPTSPSARAAPARSDRERERVVLEVARQPALDRVRVRHPERDLEHEQDERGDREVADEQPPLHRRGPARHSARARSRNPTPRTVSIQPGSPSFLRSDATCTSSVFVGPYQCGSHTFSSSSWRRSHRARRRRRGTRAGRTPWASARPRRRRR